MLFKTLLRNFKHTKLNYFPLEKVIFACMCYVCKYYERNVCKYAKEKDHVIVYLPQFPLNLKIQMEKVIAQC